LILREEVILPYHVTVQLSPHAYLLGVSLKWIISIFLILHALLRGTDVVLGLCRGKPLWTRCDITDPGARAGPRNANELMGILVGRSLSGQHFE
jgi:hypothetical protein